MAKYMPKPDAVMKNYGTRQGIYQRNFIDSMFSKKILRHNGSGKYYDLSKTIFNNHRLFALAKLNQ